jgi:hypothetical protein
MQFDYARINDLTIVVAQFRPYRTRRPRRTTRASTVSDCRLQSIHKVTPYRPSVTISSSFSCPRKSRVSDLCGHSILGIKLTLLRNGRLQGSSLLRPREIRLRRKWHAPNNVWCSAWHRSSSLHHGRCLRRDQRRWAQLPCRMSSQNSVTEKSLTKAGRLERHSCAYVENSNRSRCTFHSFGLPQPRLDPRCDHHPDHRCYDELVELHHWCIQDEPP